MPPRVRFSNVVGTARARRLRRESTPEERCLWDYLSGRQLGVKFRRQQPLGFYFADFVCFECALVIELDGGQHATPEGRARDAVRTEYLQGREFRVLRFWNNEVNGNLRGVLERIQEAIEEKRAGRG